MKYCITCHKNYSDDAATCPKCGAWLANPDDESIADIIAEKETEGATSDESVPTWMIVTGILMPMLGWVLCGALVARNDDEAAKTLAIRVLIGNIIIGVLAGIIIGSALR